MCLVCTFHLIWVLYRFLTVLYHSFIILYVHHMLQNEEESNVDVQQRDDTDTQGEAPLMCL